MKNLPDNELFEELGNRLRKYTEQPDEDVWNKIAAASQTVREPKWIFRTLYTSTAASIAAFLFLAYVGKSIMKEGMQSKSIIQQEVASKKNETENALMNGNTISQVVKEISIGDFKSSNVSTLSDDTNQNNIITMDILESEITINQHVTNKETDANNDPANGILLAKKTSNEIEITSDSTIETKAPLDSVKVQNKKPVDEKRKKDQKGFLFYCSVTPSLSYQKITPLQNDQIAVDRFESGSVLSGNRFGFSIEAGVQGKISKRFEYYGGLSYYQQNQTLSYHYKSGEGTTLENGNDPLHYTLHPGEHNNRIEYSMKNMGAQAGILYYLKGDKLTHKVGAGLSFQQGLQKAASHTTYDNSKSSYLFYQLFYRTEFSMNKSMRIFFQPNFGQAIISNEKLSEPFKLKPYRAGLSFGILYHF